MNRTSEELQKQQLQLAIHREKGIADFIPVPGLATMDAPDVEDEHAGLIDNLVDNSDFDFSKDGYLNLVPVGGDQALECFNFFRHRLIHVKDLVTTNASATVTSAAAPFKAAYTYPMSFLIHGAGGSAGETLTGTLTRVSDTTATLSTNALATITAGSMWFGDTLTEGAANALKYTGHSLFAANEGTNLNIPQWAKTDGWAEAGSLTDESWSIDAPFAINVIRPGLTVYAICIISLRTGTLPSGCKLFFGVFDGTPAQDRWIEGDNFDLSVTPIGTTGATSVSYKAIARTTDGATIESDVVTITNSNATLSASNYNRLTWTNAPGILDFTLYRLMAGVYKRIFTITNGAADYNDTGGDEATVGSFPVTHNTKAIVYKESDTYFPIVGGWVAVTTSMTIPANYNTANTTGKQWFRMGVVGPTAANRSILIDRVGLSFRPGGWARSNRDKTLIASQNPSSTPAGSTQGGTGIENENCVASSTLVRIGNDIESHWVPLGEVEQGQYIWDGARRYDRILKIRSSHQQVYRVVMSNGAWVICTESEKFVTSRADKRGTPLRELVPGDTIISPAETGISHPEIVSITEEGETDVVTLKLAAGKHLFAVGNNTDEGIKCLLAHNRKIFS